MDGEDKTVLTGALTLGSTANALSPVADYAIVPGGLGARNYEITFVKGNLTVNPKEVTVTPANSVKVYGSADPALRADVNGLVGNDTLGLTVEREAGENVAEYVIRAAAEPNPNYVVKTETATFTVTPKAVTVTADNKAKTAGQADPALTAAVDGLVRNDSLNFTLGRDAGEDVGSYAIRVTLGENPNYIVTGTDAVLTITAAPVPVTTTPAGPAAPAAPAAGGTTAAPANDNGTETVDNGRTPLAGGEKETVDDDKTPLAGGTGQASWALLNLLLAIATGIIMLVLLIGYFFGKKKKEDEEDEESAALTRRERGEEQERDDKLKRKGIVRLLSIIPTVVAIIAFILTENIWTPMVWTDKWTLLMAVIAIVQVVVAVFTKKSRKDKEDREPESGVYAEQA